MTHKKVHIDFETRSAVELKTAGTHRYATDPTTDALCLAYSFDEEPVKLWKLHETGPLDLMKAIHNKITVAAHNAHFEFMIWNFVCYKKYGWPSLDLSQLDCTMIRGYAMGLPGTLEKAAKSVGLAAEKDMKGQRIMLQLAKPRSYDSDGKPIFWEPTDLDPKVQEKFKTLYKYCKNDVIVERELDKRLLPLPESELRLWYLDQKINYRGVFCDIPAAKNALEIVDVEKKRLDSKMRDMTQNQVATCNASIALKKYINSYDLFKGEIYAEDGPLVTYTENGKKKKRRQYKKGEKKIIQGVGKDIILDLLEMKLPKRLKEVLLLRQEAAKSSTAKLTAMISGASSDDRIRGCFQYYGAASTGRWAGRRIQLQNMTRPTIKQPEIEQIINEINSENILKDKIDNISIFHGPVIPRISDCLRGILCADNGKKLIAVDFSAIEGRVLAWLAGQEDILNVFRGHGKIYEHTAAQIYGVENIDDVDSEQRQIGKVATLALGYQGGVKAFQSMAKNYFVKVPDEQAETIKVNWRKSNNYIVNYWYELERAAIAAANNEGQKFGCGPKGRQVMFLKKGSFLFCRLPSGRAICYPYPKMKNVKTPWDAIKNALTYKGEENYHFVTKVAYGGLIAENITQATARDLLAEGMFRFEQKGYNIIMHVHDELVCEVDERFGSVKEACDILCELPNWAKGLPIKAEGWSGKRYRK